MIGFSFFPYFGKVDQFFFGGVLGLGFFGNSYILKKKSKERRGLEKERKGAQKIKNDGFSLKGRSSTQRTVRVEKMRAAEESGWGEQNEFIRLMLGLVHIWCRRQIYLIRGFFYSIT